MKKYVFILNFQSIISILKYLSYIGGCIFLDIKYFQLSIYLSMYLSIYLFIYLWHHQQVQGLGHIFDLHRLDLAHTVLGVCSSQTPTLYRCKL